MDRVFFTNSGTEAVEGALKLARIRARQRNPAGARRASWPWKIRFTAGRLAPSRSPPRRNTASPSRRWFPGVDFVRFNDVADLESKFDASVCAVVIETIQGEGGVYPVSEAFWTRARELATRHDAALIADEIQCGLGRTGRYFAYQRFAGRPDIVLVAKPLAGGLPLGAVLARESFASAFSPGLHGTTFGGGPLACAVALEFLSTVEQEGLLENVRRRSAQIRAGLEALKFRFDFVREIRGEGLILGLELARQGAPYVEEALRRGLIINCTHDFTLRFLPPFVIGRQQVQEFLEKLETVFIKTRSSQSRLRTRSYRRAAQAKR